MEFVYNKLFFLFAIIIIGSQLFHVCTETLTDTNSIDLTKRYRLDKKDISTTNDHEEQANDDHLLLMNKRYRFDKRYRLDKKQVDMDGINKRYRLDKRYRFD